LPTRVRGSRGVLGVSSKVRILVVEGLDIFWRWFWHAGNCQSRHFLPFSWGVWSGRCVGAAGEVWWGRGADGISG